MEPYPELMALRNSTHTLIMGILNITTDSFSDGGQWIDPHDAIQHALAMMHDGASIIDVGAESTRPGAHRVDEAVELKRDAEIVRRLAPLARTAGCFISVDTTRASVARACLDAGAHMINDISGGCLDSAMAPLIASRRCLYVVQRWNHWFAGTTFGGSHLHTSPHTVVADIIDRLRTQITDVLHTGVNQQQIIVDPGLGFGIAGPELNDTVIAHLSQIAHLGYPVLIGASRKGFLSPAPVHDLARRDAMTAVISAAAAQQGAWAVRVHNVAVNHDALTIQARLATAQKENDSR